MDKIWREEGGAVVYFKAYEVSDKRFKEKRVQKLKQLSRKKEGLPLGDQLGRCQAAVIGGNNSQINS
jgi:hypothetical protein